MEKPYHNLTVRQYFNDVTLPVPLTGTFFPQSITEMFFWLEKISIPLSLGGSNKFKNQCKQKRELGVNSILQLIKGGILAHHFYKEAKLWKLTSACYWSTCYIFIKCELDTTLTQIHSFTKQSLSPYYVLGTLTGPGQVQWSFN